jgi:ribosomal protein S18 acetylase RimI-like enzyme
VIGLEIRDYLPSDQPNVLRFFEEVLPALGFTFDVQSKDSDLLRIDQVYQSQGGKFLIALVEGEVVGTIALRKLDEQTCELKRFYVLERCRGNGIGRRLLEAVIAHGRAGKWKTMLLDTSSKSPAALSLFRAQGFVEIPRYNRDPFAEIFMALSMR